MIMQSLKIRIFQFYLSVCLKCLNFPSNNANTTHFQAQKLQKYNPQ